MITKWFVSYPFSKVNTDAVSQGVVIASFECIFSNWNSGKIKSVKC